MVLSQSDVVELVAAAVNAFQGDDRLLQSQLPGLTVAAIPETDSFQLRPTQGVPLGSVRGVFADADLADVDGVPVHVLLHIMDGRLAELEIYRDDLGRLKAPIVPSQVIFYIHGPSKL